MPLLSIIIVAYQAKDSLRNCLQSLFQLSQLNREIIVVDNASGPSMASLAHEFPQVQWIWNKSNLGYAPAANQGARKSSGDILLFLNPDTLVFEHSIENMLSKLSNPKIGAVGPLSNYSAGWQNILYHLPENRIQNRENQGDEIIKMLGHVYAKQSKSVKLLVGFCLMIRRDVFEQMQGMDDELILGLDDLDLSWRLRLAGYEIHAILDSYVFHQGQQSFAHANSFRADWEKIGHRHFSQKLTSYYGHFSKIPKSWDLWEIDWFQAEDYSATMIQLGLDSFNIILDLNHPHLQKQAVHLCHDLLDFGFSTEQIIAIGPKRNLIDLPDSIPCLSSALSLEQFWPKIKSLFDPSSILIVLCGDYELRRGTLQNLSSLDGAKRIDEGPPSPPSQVSAFAIPASHPWPTLLAGSTITSAPEIFEPRSSIETWKIGLEDIRGFAHRLRQHRLTHHSNLILEFDNALVQWDLHGDPFGLEGLCYFDVERELNQGGWRVERIDGMGNLYEERDLWKQLEIQRQGRFQWEKTLASYPKLRLYCQSLSQEYHTELKVSFVILALNKVEYTKQCIDSIQAHCRQSYELILINNGSTDGTRSYFDSILGAKVIHNDRNLGVAAGWNQGMEIATGDYILIFNNDTLVPPLAIENMVRCAQNFPKAGIVAPRSNNIAGPQWISDFPNKLQGDLLYGELQNRQQKNDLSAWQFQRIKGFCMLIPAEIAKEVGPFDESFGLGNFEDDDYSLRVFLKGYDLLVADDSLIFHYGSVSFDQAGVDWTQQMTRNQAIFQNKWAKGRLSLQNTEAKPEAPRGNEIDKLKAQLSGGNQDASIYYQLAQIFEAQNSAVDALLNYSKALECQANSNWAAQLGRFMRNNLSSSERGDAKVYLNIRFPQFSHFWDDGGIAVPEMDWAKAVEKDLQCGDTEAAERKLNSLSPEQKKSFDGLNLFGILHFYRNQTPMAFEYFENALKIQPTNEDCLINYFDAGVKLRHFQRVADQLERALALNSNLDEVRRQWEDLKAFAQGNSSDPERLIHFRERNLAVENLLKEGLYDKAKDDALALLALDPNNARTLNNLGLIHWYQGELEPAWQYFIKCSHHNILFVDGIVNLFDCAVILNRLEDFMPIFQQAQQASPYQKELQQIHAHFRDGTLPERLHIYFDQKHNAIQFNVTLNQAHDYLELRDYGRAIDCYLSIIDKDGESYEAFNGLGLSAWYLNRFGDAFIAFRKAAEIKPHDIEALHNLWDAAKITGRIQEARPFLENLLSMEPHLTEISNLLREGDLS